MFHVKHPDAPSYVVDRIRSHADNPVGSGLVCGNWMNRERGVPVPVETLTTIRDRLLPMMEVIAREYGPRTPAGYPVIVDEPERGAVGLMLDASHGLHVVTDGTALFVELNSRSSRTDARSSAGRAKYSGMPFNDRRPVSVDISDQELRNLLSELVARWNVQPRIIHITDT